MSENTSEITSDQNRSPFALLLGTIIFVAGIILYAVTGVDVFGVVETDDFGIPGSDIEITLGGVETLSIEQGLGYEKGFWKVYFTAPTGSNDRSTYVNGIDTFLADAIANARNTIDMAAFELNNPVITEAIRDAHNRGVEVRIVTDDEFGINDDDTTLRSLRRSGVIIRDDRRTGLMHNKFVIIDGISVWTGSWNYTVNGTYRNNNNALVLRSIPAVRAYQAEFNEMYEDRSFGPTSSEENTGGFRQDGVPIQIYFAPENDIIDKIIDEVNQASSMRFYAFSFTENALGNRILELVENGNLALQGVFETSGSETRFSELTKFFCAGLDVYQDGNSRLLHHKVILLDNDTIILGSANFSGSATETNDENIMIIREPDLFQLYLAEYERIRSIARRPDPNDLDCTDIYFGDD